MHVACWCGLLGEAPPLFVPLLLRLYLPVLGTDSLLPLSGFSLADP